MNLRTSEGKSCGTILMCVIAPLMFNMQGGPAGMALELNRGVVCMEPDEFQRVKGGKN